MKGSPPKHFWEGVMGRLLRDEVKGVLVTLALAVGAGLALAAPADARQPDFTIEQVMSAPFPSSLVAAPAGGRVAWVYDAGGTRNVWVAEPGPNGYTSHPLTHYTGDDGFDMGQVAWDPSGQTVFYIRGGSLEGGGLGQHQGAAPKGRRRRTSGPCRPLPRRRTAQDRSWAIRRRVSPKGDKIAVARGRADLRRARWRRAAQPKTAAARPRSRRRRSPGRRTDRRSSSPPTAAITP